MYVWAVLNAPLMAGNDLTRMTDEVRDLLAHPDIIAVDQDWGGQQGRVTFTNGELEIWSKPMSQTSGWSAASVLLNRGDATGRFDLDQIFESSNELRDVWSGDSVSKGTAEVAAHDAILLLSR